MEKKKGLFVVEEFKNFSTNSGAYHHCIIGFDELSKYYDLTWYKKGTRGKTESTKSTHLKIIPFLRRLGIIGTGKDFLKIIKELYQIPQKIVFLKKNKIEFVYQRANYLGFSWLVACKVLHISHFFEVNGIFSSDILKYRKSMLNKFISYIEKEMYSYTDMGFYVGGINEELGITGANVAIVQNGIDEKYIDQANRHSEISKEQRFQTISKVVFVGHIMEHHRLDLLMEAISKLNNNNGYELHIIGKANTNIDLEKSNSIKTIIHGEVEHNELPGKLCYYDVGIIPFSKDYYSNMKLFLYAASRLIIILPRSKNFTRIFNDDEVLFFENLNVKDLALKIVKAKNLSGKEKQIMAEKAFSKVKNNYTWQQIYAKQKEAMDNCLSS